MINGFSDYKETETKEFSSEEKLELGAHICKILKVEIEEIFSQKNNQKYNILKVQFDIEEPDKQAGFYQRKFKKAAQEDASNAKWKGYYRLSIPTNDSPEFIKSNWKTFLTSIEKSNPGINIDGSKGFDENLLVGKIFVGVFGLEEMVLPTNGKTIAFTKIRFVRSINSINNTFIPKVKLLDGTYMDYDEYMKNKNKNENDSRNYFSNMNENESNVFNDSDELPF